MRNITQRTASMLILCCFMVLTCTTAIAAETTYSVENGTGETFFVGDAQLMWPVPGSTSLSSCFLDCANPPITHTKPHCAIDILAENGSEVVAAYDGVVEEFVNSKTDNYAKSNGEGFGNYVVLSHNLEISGNVVTLYTRYSHLSCVEISTGESVKKGQVIGRVGSTGNSSGFHLDFQVLNAPNVSSVDKYDTYSIDPFMNHLLELPEGLHSGADEGSYCCGNYLHEVTELYETFTTKSSEPEKEEPFSLTLSTNSKTKVRSEPNGKATVVRRVKKGTQLQAAGYTVNEKGNLWYQLADGGYIFAGNVSPASSLSVTQLNVPTGKLMYGQVFIIDGCLISGYPFTVTATIKTKFGDQKIYEASDVSADDGTYTLRLSSIDKALLFNKLARQSYSYILTVTEHADCGNICRDITTVVAQSDFTIE